MNLGLPKIEIAVIGMACRYPGGVGTTNLWGNLLAGRRQFRCLPTARGRLDLDLLGFARHDVLSSRLNAALVEGFSFDWASRRIPRTTFEVTDIAHWLALDTVLMMLGENQGLLDAKLSDRTAVYVGNTLTGETSRATSLVLRWPYVRRTMEGALRAHIDSAELRDVVLTETERLFKARLPAPNEDTLAGSLSNTIAGRICNYLDLHGGGYTVDGACASSLLAVITGCNELSRGAIDLAIAGGVDVSLDPFELVGFEKVGALAKEDMRVYDRRANGFFPGEGCGFVALKRLADAHRDGDYIYAVVKGWGISSDGKGGITAPKAEGQALAQRRAHEHAGIDPHTIDFIEGHGTGTELGDKVELEGIALALNHDTPARVSSCGITSLKSIIGHTKAAAGIGGLIKAVLAVNQRVLPPTANCEQPNPAFDGNAACLYPLIHGEIRPKDAVLTAGVSAMGFGGVNSHLIVQSGDPPDERLRPALPEQALFVSHETAELFVFSDSSVEDMARRLLDYAVECEYMSYAELTDFAVHVARQTEPSEPVRAAVVAGSPRQLVERLEALGNRLKAGLRSKEIFSDAASGIYASNATETARVGFLFPGQGAQRFNMVGTLAHRHEELLKVVHDCDASARTFGIESLSEHIFRSPHKAFDDSQRAGWEAELAETRIAQPAIAMASLIWMKYLRTLGLRPSVVGGHSLGELAAFRCAGALSDEEFIKLACTRGAAMSATSANAGAMAAIACDDDGARRLITGIDGYVTIANLNSPRQTVVSGDPAGISSVIERAGRSGIGARRLPVSNAFHSRYVAHAVDAIRALTWLPEAAPLPESAMVSAREGAVIGANVRLREYLASQIVAPVDFVALVRGMANHCDVLIEVGPGRTLSNLVADILGNEGIPCLPVESNPDGHDDIKRALAMLFIRRVDIDWEQTWKNRLFDPYRPFNERKFIENPCATPVAFSASGTRASRVPIELPGQTGSPSSTQTTVSRQSWSGVVPTVEQLMELIAACVVEITGGRRELIRPESVFESDLNLDSLKRSELAGAVYAAVALSPGRSFVDLERRHQLGRLMVREFAQAIALELESTGGEVVDDRRNAITGSVTASGKSIAHSSAASVSPWTHSFSISFDRVDALPFEAETWRRRSVLLLCENSAGALSSALTHLLRDAGATVNVADMRDREAISGTNVDHLIAVIPGPDVADAQVAVRDLVTRLREVGATCIRLASKNVGFRASLVRLPGMSSDGEVLSLGAYRSFGATLHLEANIPVSVLSVQPGSDPIIAAKAILSEAAHAAGFICARVDQQGNRFLPQANLLRREGAPKRRRRIEAGDVVLVTGGARGITAECALALARETGARLALVGSTRIDSDSSGKYASEVRASLARFAEAGVEASYYVCDVGDAEDLSHLIKCVQADCGRIDAVIHGAGINRPALIGDGTPDQAMLEIAPKLLAGINLCRAFEQQPPKLFAALTSVIGVTGMNGNAWYGFANEALDAVLDQFGARHPNTEIATLAYSVWDRIGIAADSSVTEFLVSKGILAIPVAEGVSAFLHWMEHRAPTSQVLVCGRLGALGTWPGMAMLPPATSVPFLETRVSDLAGVECIYRARLDVTSDPYLLDHRYAGTMLFPAVYGLEAMAQAVSRVTRRVPLGPVDIENIAFSQRIVVEPSDGATIEIHAEVLDAEDDRESIRVQCSIRCAETGFAVDHFSATFVLGRTSALGTLPTWAGARTDVRPDRDLYGHLLFQGPRFRRMQHIFGLTDTECRFLVSTFRPGPDKAASRECAYVLGDPYARDALLQAGQATIPDLNCLPTAIRRLSVRKLDRPVLAESRAVLVDRRADELEFCIEVSGESGEIAERMEGYCLRILSKRPNSITVEELAQPEGVDTRRIGCTLQRASAVLRLDAPTVRISYSSSEAAAKGGWHAVEERLLRDAVSAKVGTPGVSNCSLGWLESGRPVVAGEACRTLHVSFSHDDAVCVCAVGDWIQGCDLVSGAPRSKSQWLSILGRLHDEALSRLNELGDDDDTAGRRLFAAIECFFKATQDLPQRFVVHAHSEEFVLIEGIARSETVSVLTFPFQLVRGGKPTLGFVVKPASIASKSMPPSREWASEFDSEFRAHLDLENVLHVRSPVALRDCTGPERGIAFTTYFQWMGRVREIGLRPVMDALGKTLFKGHQSVVTGSYRLSILEHASIADVVETRMRLTDLGGSTVRLGFEWCRVGSAKPAMLLASGEMNIAWVKVLADGNAQLSPFPESIREYFETVEARDVPHEEPVPKERYLGLTIWRKGAASDSDVVVAEKEFVTSLEDSNAVGNIYFSCYTSWLSRVSDAYFHGLCPDLFNASGPVSMTCTDVSMSHLREAFPFDVVRVKMSVDALFECGLVLGFSYFRVEARGETKLAIGQQTIRFSRRDHGQVGASCSPPNEVVQALNTAIRTTGHDEVPVRLSGRSNQFVN